MPDIFENLLKIFYQILINNSYENAECDQELEKFLQKKLLPTNDQIDVYYKNQMIASHKLIEKLLNILIKIIYVPLMLKKNII